MASIKYDADGFPIGELVKSGKDFAAELEIQSGLLRNIRTDVRSIARAVGAQVAQVRRSSTPAAAAAASHREAARRGASSPAGRAGSSRAAALVAGTPAGRERAAAAARAGRSPVAAAGAGGRDARGRFTAGSKKGQDAGSSGAQASPMLGAALSRLSDGVGRLSASISGADSVDANIAAANEVRQVVAPLGRGFSFLFSRNTERKKERWRDRVLRALTGKKAGGATVVAAGAQGGGFGLPGLLGMLGAIPGLGKLGAVGGALGGLFGGLRKGAGGLLRRIPFLGALLAGGTALSGILGLDDDPNATPAENRARRFKGVGEAAGTGIGGLFGGVLGSVLGPAGTIGGAWLGSLIGEKVGGVVGEWSRQLIDSDIPGQVMQAWGTFTAFASGAWSSLSTDAMAAWSGVVTKASTWWDSAQSVAETALKVISDVSGTANAWVKEKTGIDVKEHVATAWDATKSAAGNAWERVKQGAADAGAAALAAAKTAAVAAVPETIKRAVDAGARAAAEAKGRYDAADGGTISKVLAAVGMRRVYQRADGSVEQRDGGSVSWRNNNQGNLKFEYAGSADKTVKTSRTREQALAAAKARYAGVVDLDQWGNAIFASDAAGRAAHEQLLRSKHGGKTVEEMLPSYAVSDYSGKADHAAYAAAIHRAAAANGVDLRGKRIGDLNQAEMTALMSGMRTMEGHKAGTVTGGAPAITAGGLPRAPQSPIPSPVPSQIPPTPDYKEPPHQLNAQAREKVIVVPTPAEPGQNVGDRGLAHVVTGGIGLRS